MSSPKILIFWHQKHHQIWSFLAPEIRALIMSFLSLTVSIQSFLLLFIDDYHFHQLLGDFCQFIGIIRKLLYIIHGFSGLWVGSPYFMVYRNEGKRRLQFLTDFFPLLKGTYSL